jgi:diguanylate cyclase (GGDEF)-like protein
VLPAKQLSVRSCAHGFLCFVIPLPENRNLPDYLIGCVAFEHHGRVTHVERAQPLDEPGTTIVKQKQHSRPVSASEAELAIRKIPQILPQILDRQIHILSLSRTTQRLEAVQKLNRDLSDCTDIDQAMDIVSEALVVLFNLPRVMIVLQKPGQAMTVHSTLGLDPDSFQLDQSRLADYLNKSSCQPEVLPGDELTTFFQGLETRSAQIFPIAGREFRLGIIVILDLNLHNRDQALIELLINGLAARLENLETAASHELEQKFSARLISMISALSLVTNSKELYHQILEMSAELLEASCGSLMLLNESDGSMEIETAKGMNPALAKAMKVTFGEGIAGHVAKSGFPMLVNDIERDKRVAYRNRPRFKTKSFISLPLVYGDRMIGVLNLADKINGSSFTEQDLNRAQTFTGHAVPMIDRAATLEKAGQFEQLSITDPLTGLYNRRFLEDRLQEEFSRSGRHKQNFCVILADLDNFKMYNDICGHLAGDRVLCKAASLLRRTARDMDVVSRYGGEEFCIILPGTGKKESVFVGERIRRTIETESFPGESHLPLGRLTISLGIASFPADGVTANELIHAADLALYRAKAVGRNRLVLYEPSLEEKALPALRG